MIQNENSSRKIKENKYKILRMSLLLGTDTDKEETINNFEDASREIDAINNETYLEELESKFYDTETLEEESKKLTELVDYIAGRISQRESLISDFINVTGKNLTGLPEIKYENKLSEYQERLKYINEYLDNSKKIEEETTMLENLTASLKEEEYQKEENEKKNEELENLLRKKFTSIASNKIDIDSLNEDNIETKILELDNLTEESKKSLDIFTKSFATLKNAGLNYEEEVEYKSYVEGARDVYYEYKEETYLLNIYKLLLSNETEYINIYNKRETISNILNERIELRNDLGINEEDCLDSIYEILAHQTEIVAGEKENIDNIKDINDKIKYCQERIEELKEDNEKVEILSILKEYNIIDTYEEEPDTKEEEIEIPTYTEQDYNFKVPELNFDVSEIQEEQPVEEPSIDTVPEPTIPEPSIEEKEEPPTDIPYRNNFVMGSHEPLGLNVDECIEKATSVMKRVGKMLNIENTKEPEPTPAPTKEEEKEELKVPEIQEEQPTEIPVASPFVEPTSSPFINEEVSISPFVNNEEKEELPTPEESNVKNVLPSAESFWNNKTDEEENTKEENSDFPNLTVSNDDFFANNMDNFEFPNLDEFK